MHTHEYSRPLFPNLYVTLVGGPGVGKSIAIDQTKSFWREVPELHIAPDTMTKAGMIDALKAAHRIIPMGGTYTEFHSLLIPADELSVLVPAYDLEFMGVLNKLYDCQDRFEELLRKYDGERLVIPRVQVCFVAGAQPSYLASAMPEVAWGQGFLSRNILVYSPRLELKSLFDSLPHRKFLKLALANDIKRIASLQGEMTWDDAARQTMDEWHLAGGPPKPTHPKLAHYCPRRPLHLMKLSMVASLSRSDDLRITMDDWQTALTWLLEAEASTPGIFRDMATGGDSAVLYDTWTWMWDDFAKDAQAFPERRIIHFLSCRIGLHNVLKALENMESSGMIAKQGLDQRPGRCQYIPIAKEKWSSAT